MKPTASPPYSPYPHRTLAEVPPEARMNYRLITDASDSARNLALIGAQVRQERARAKRRAFHRELREQLGLPEAEALR